MKTIIAGSRTANDYAALLYAVRNCGWRISHVVSGGASGADKLGERFARENQLPLTIFEADWKAHGKSAGPIRNERMAFHSDALIALWDGRSRGTRHMIDAAKRRGLKVYVRRIDFDLTP